MASKDVNPLKVVNVPKLFDDNTTTQINSDVKRLFQKLTESHPNFTLEQERELVNDTSKECNNILKRLLHHIMPSTDISDTITSDTVTSDTITSDTVTSDTITSDTITSDTVTSDTVTSNIVTSIIVTFDTVTTDTVTTDTVITDTAAIDTAAIDTVTSDNQQVSEYKKQISDYQKQIAEYQKQTAEYQKQIYELQYELEENILYSRIEAAEIRCNQWKNTVSEMSKEYEKRLSTQELIHKSNIELLKSLINSTYK